MLGAILLAGCGAKTEKDDLTKQETQSGETEQKVTESSAEVAEINGAEGEVYSSHGITVSFPADWTGRYVITENDTGFSVYQKASYEKQEGMGYLFELYCGTEFMNYGAGEYLLAYSDDGMLYYLMQPTDVPCDLEDENISGEYMLMCQDLDEILGTIQIDGEVHWDAKEYVIPVSSIMALNEDMLLDYSDNDLRIAKNEIYARHGRMFDNTYLQSYFNSCSWYEGTIEPSDFSESTLSQLEVDNLKVLTARKDTLAEENPYPKEFKTGEMVKVDLTGDGTLNEVHYQVMDMGNDEYSYRLTIDGVTYELGEGIYMCTPVTDVFYITDISTYEKGLEIAVLDEGPSNDPVTYFYRYDGEMLSYIGEVSGFPFPEQNQGVNGFDGYGSVTGIVRVDLIETAYVEGCWYYDYDEGKLEYEDNGWHPYASFQSHELYADLPVHSQMDVSSKGSMIPAQKEVYFTLTDGEEWILVKGKDGSSGYVQVKDEKVVELDKPASEVFSDLYYFD